MISGPRRAFLAGGGVVGALAATSAARAVGAARGGAFPLLSTYVAGVGYHAAPESVSRLQSGDELVLRRRPDSAYDPRTIEVRTRSNELLGHLPRIDNQALSRLMDAGVPARATVWSVSAVGSRPEIRIEVAVFLA